MARRRTRRRQRGGRSSRRQRGGRDEGEIKSDIEQKETVIKMATNSLNQLQNELKAEQDRKKAEAAAAAAASGRAQSRWGKIKTRGFAQIGVEKAEKRLEELRKCLGPGRCGSDKAQTKKNLCLSYEYNPNAPNDSNCTWKGDEEPKSTGDKSSEITSIAEPVVEEPPVVQKEKMTNSQCRKKTCATNDAECNPKAKKQGKVPCEQKGDCVLSKKSNGAMVCTNPDGVPSGSTRVGTGGRSRRRRRRKRNKTRKGKRTKKRRRRKRKRTRKR